MKKTFGTLVRRWLEIYTVKLLLLANVLLLIWKLATPTERDLIRENYIRDSRFYFHQGCLAGVDYDKEYDPTKFDRNSPGFYCANRTGDMDSIFKESSEKLELINGIYKRKPIHREIVK